MDLLVGLIIIVKCYCTGKSVWNFADKGIMGGIALSFLWGINHARKILVVKKRGEGGLNFTFFISNNFP